MKKLLRKFLWSVLRCLLWCRYEVEVRGLEKLQGIKGPILVWPNHPAYVDPPMVISHLQFGPTLRPLVFADTYRSYLFYPLMKLIEAREVPNLSSHSRDAHRQTTEMIDGVAERLKAGESFLIYPSGRLQRTGKEIVGGARIAHELLQRVDNVTVVLVRTRGLWGSRFGCAQTGGVPDLASNSLRSLGWILASLFFFMPRRKVTITVEPIEIGQLPTGGKAELNGFLEEYYNQDGGEDPKFVPYHHWFGKRRFDYQSVQAGQDVDTSDVPADVAEAVNEMVEQHLDRPLESAEKDPATTLDVIGLDSLERMDLSLEIEQRFGFRSDSVPVTLGQLWLLAAGKTSGEEKPLKSPPGWLTGASKREGNPEVLAETISESFVRRALARPGDIAIADALSGALNYRKLLIGATLMSKRFRDLPGDAVGVMLPASVAADVTYMALLLAGKLPVMLNWTTGPAGIRHAIEKLEIQRVVTSKRFLDRLGVEVPGAEPVLLEEIRGGIGTAEKLTTLLATYLLKGSFLRSLPPERPDQPAVVLFTSGSESLPKAVPLSHQNLICNIRGGIAHMDFRRRDALFGFLPPFHSFGLTATMLMPILAGIRVVHHADPTDARMLARMIAAYRPSLMFSTPTFLQYAVGASLPDELISLRLVLVGAEKCPEPLYRKVKELLPDLALLEGYGITECSPVVSGNMPGHNKPGTIGLPIREVTTLVVHAETHETLSTDETGLLLVRGSTVFSGYLHHDGPQPFIEAEGHQWYNTGDLVKIDDDGFIHFQGRLKRFIKAGGEMISLPALEQPLADAYPADDDGAQVAVEGIETESGRKIVLFSRVEELTTRTANDILKKHGMQGIMRIDEVRKIDAIPVLGTGKTDYRKLRGMIENGASQG